MHLTEKQCALLDGYMYLDQSVKKRGKRSGNTIGETIKDLKGKTTGQFKLDQLNPTGGITKEEAVSVLYKTTVLSSLCGRICPHKKQCEGSCVRGIKGEPVEIGNLESFVGDLAIENSYKITILFIPHQILLLLQHRLSLRQ